jgi:orotate phosphoribosyltransferase
MAPVSRNCTTLRQAAWNLFVILACAFVWRLATMGAIAMVEAVTHTREALRALLVENSLRMGDFVLASGQCSRVYVDAKLTTCRAQAMPLIGAMFLERMQEQGWRPMAVGGLTMGADPISAAIASESLKGPVPIDFFVVRKEPKKHGMQKFLEGVANPEGLQVVVVDDVCTTGGSTITAVERCREAGMLVLGAICLVDREQGARENLAAIGCELVSVFRLRDLTGEPPA